MSCPGPCSCIGPCPPDPHPPVWEILGRAGDLGLADWDIRVAVVDGLAPTHYSAIDYRETEKVAQVKLDRSVAECGDQTFMSRCVAHELVHLALRRYENLANQAVANLPEPLRTTMAALLEDELEIVTEAMAGALVPASTRFKPLDGKDREDWPSW